MLLKIYFMHETDHINDVRPKMKHETNLHIRTEQKDDDTEYDFQYISWNQEKCAKTFSEIFDSSLYLSWALLIIVKTYFP